MQFILSLLIEFSFRRFAWKLSLCKLEFMVVQVEEQSICIVFRTTLLSALASMHLFVRIQVAVPTRRRVHPNTMLSPMNFWHNLMIFLRKIRIEIVHKWRFVSALRFFVSLSDNFLLFLLLPLSWLVGSATNEGTGDLIVDHHFILVEEILWDFVLRLKFSRFHYKTQVLLRLTLHLLIFVIFKILNNFYDSHFFSKTFLSRFMGKSDFPGLPFGGFWSCTVFSRLGTVKMNNSLWQYYFVAFGLLILLSSPLNLRMFSFKSYFV